MKRPAESLSPLEMWSVFLKFAPDPKYRDFVNKIIEIKEEVGMASALLMEISKDEHERARLRSRRMYETDRYSDMATSEERGGLMRAQAIARTMLAKGVDVDTTAEYTGLTVDDILHLK